MQVNIPQIMLYILLIAWSTIPRPKGKSNLKNIH